MSNKIHVVPKQDKWAVERENAERVTKYLDTKAEAEKFAKQLAKNEGGNQVVIHGRNGRIQDADTIPNANDPFPPRDRKH